MNTEQEAREGMAQQRQQEEHIQQSMLSRAKAEINTSIEPDIQQEARELMAEQRQQEEHMQQSMLMRSSAEVGIPVETENSSQDQ